VNMVMGITTDEEFMTITIYIILKFSYNFNVKKL
jgi:hypothetical protein